MTVEIGLVLAIVACALYLFASQKLPLDVSALVIMVTLIVIPIVGDPIVRRIGWLREHDVDLRGAFPTVEEGLSGLSSPATVTVLAMFILSAGVQRSGLMHVLGRKMMPFVGNSELRLFLVIVPLVGVISGFVNNTAAVAVSIPFVLDMCRQLGLQASRLLMPLSFFGMLGGMLTLVGTSTNILASTLLADDGGPVIGMFEFTSVGLLVLAVGLIYFLVIGRFLLPKTDLGGEVEAAEEFVVEVSFPAESPWLEGSLEESGAAVSSGVTVLTFIRDRQIHRTDVMTEPLQPGDLLQVRGTVRQIADLVSSDDINVQSDFSPSRVTSKDSHLVRVLVRNRLLFAGSRADQISFWSRYRARLVGVETKSLSTRLSDKRLNVGEILLLEIAEDALPALRRHPDVVLLSEFEDEFDRRRMWTAGAILVAVVAAAAITPMPIVVTALLGVIAMAVSDCVTKDDLYSGVPWEVIFLLAGVIPLGVAMTKSGGADWLAGLLASAASNWPPLLVLIALYVFTTLLTEMVSNNASVVILVPVAISLSVELGIGVLPLVLTVMFAASTSFLSPVGYQTNAMVYGTGLYKFTDFAKVGGPLNVILAVVTPAAIWTMWV